MPLFTWKRKPKISPELAHTWQQYTAGFRRRIPPKTPISDLRFVVLDTETTGLDYQRDRLLSIAALPIINYQVSVSDRLEAFFYQEEYEPVEESVSVHGIMSKHVEEGSQEVQVLTRLLAYLSNSIIVGHHISFDLAILSQATQRHFGAHLKNPTLDTAWLAKRVDNPLIRAFNPQPLDSLCQQYNIPLGKRHTAAADCYITTILFLKLLTKLEGRGVKTYRDLMRKH